MAMFRVASRNRRRHAWPCPLPLPLPLPPGAPTAGLQHELVDVVDAGLAAHAVELLGQLGGEQLRELAAQRLLARDAAELLDLRVPALHAVVQVRRQDAHVDGFDDVLAEFLQPLVLLHLALQRAVERGVLDGDADIAGQRQQQFHVHAGEVVAVVGPAHPR